MITLDEANIPAFTQLAVYSTVKVIDVLMKNFESKLKSNFTNKLKSEIETMRTTSNDVALKNKSVID